MNAMTVAASPFSVAARHNMTSSEYTNAYFDFKNKGYRLQCVSGYEEGGVVKFAAVWKKETGPRLSKYSKFKCILISRLMDSSRLNNRLELIENRC